MLGNDFNLTRALTCQNQGRVLLSQLNIAFEPLHLVMRLAAMKPSLLSLIFELGASEKSIRTPSRFTAYPFEELRL